MSYQVSKMTYTLDYREISVQQEPFMRPVIAVTLDLEWKKRNLIS